MRVLLVNPPDETEEMLGVGRRLVHRWEPLGLLFVAAVAREAGHEVAVIDAPAEDLDLESLKARIRSAVPEVVGISTLTCSGAPVWDLGRWLRAELPGTRVVLGNIHASVYAEQYLRHGCCDVVVHGEGEFSFRALLERMGRGETDYSGVEAVSYLGADGTLVRTGQWAVVPDLEVLPLPARDLVDGRRYGLEGLNNQTYVCRKGERAGTLVTSRGCQFRCRFCVVHHGQRPRYLPAARVVDELQMLERERGMGYVFFHDPNFMGDRNRVLGICQGILDRGLGIRWGCAANVNLLDADLVRAMQGANCREIALGIESGVQRILDAVEKRITPDRARQALETIRANSDIRTVGLFILGLPGETREDICQTMRLATALDLDMAQFSILTPYPGSPIFEDLAARGELDTGVRRDGSVDTSVWKRYSSYIMYTDRLPIWVTPGLTARELRRLQKQALRRFYLRPRQFLQQVRRLRPGGLVSSVKLALQGLF